MAAAASPATRRIASRLTGIPATFRLLCSENTFVVVFMVSPSYSLTAFAGWVGEDMDVGSIGAADADKGVTVLQLLNSREERVVRPGFRAVRLRRLTRWTKDDGLPRRPVELDGPPVREERDPADKLLRRLVAGRAGRGEDCQIRRDSAPRS